MTIRLTPVGYVELFATFPYIVATAYPWTAPIVLLVCGAGLYLILRSSRREKGMKWGILRSVIMGFIVYVAGSQVLGAVVGYTHKKWVRWVVNNAGGVRIGMSREQVDSLLAEGGRIEHKSEGDYACSYDRAARLLLNQMGGRIDLASSLRKLRLLV